MVEMSKREHARMECPVSRSSIEKGRGQAYGFGNISNISHCCEWRCIGSKVAIRRRVLDQRIDKIVGSKVYSRLMSRIVLDIGSEDRRYDNLKW